MEPERRFRVLVVDDHPVVRLGLRAVEENCRDLQVVGTAGTGATALEQVASLRPDVVLLDIRLPDLSGFEVCGRIKRQHPGTKVLFLTSFADGAMVLQALGSGADGYLLKDHDATKIADALLKVVRGGAVFDPSAALAPLQPEGDGASRQRRWLRELTPREREVLAGVATGKTDKEVATTLGLESKTVRNYMSRIMEKLGVSSRTEAAVLFVRHGAGGI
jgi:DNA-binding NarL/FixJ family response regulator